MKDIVGLIVAGIILFAFAWWMGKSQRECEAKGGTYFIQEYKCLKVQELK